MRGSVLGKVCARSDLLRVPQLQQEGTLGPAARPSLRVGLPVIRLTLYGISGRAQATYDLKPGEQLDVEHRPVFTVTRIVAEPVHEQLDMENARNDA